MDALVATQTTDDAPSLSERGSASPGVAVPDPALLDGEARPFSSSSIRACHLCMPSAISSVQVWSHGTIQLSMVKSAQVT